MVTSFVTAHNFTDNHWFLGDKSIFIVGVTHNENILIRGMTMNIIIFLGGCIELSRSDTCKLS